jgi:Concanavalin A-like lectin/glucanases superfamily
MAWSFANDGGLYVTGLPTSGTTTWTMFIWANFTSVTDAGFLIKNGSSNNDGVSVQIKADGKLRCTHRNTGGGSSNQVWESTSSAFASTGQWYAVGVSHGAMNVWTPYVNGSAVAGAVTITGSGTEDTDVSSMCIGARANASDTNSPSCSMAVACRWDVVLTAGEHLALATGADPRSIRPEKLIFYAPLIRSLSVLTSSHVLALTAGGPSGVAETNTHPPVRQLAYPHLGLAASGGGGATLTAETASFALTGQAAGLYGSRKLASETASYALTGYGAGLAYGRRITADTAAFNFTGQNVGLLLDRIMAVDSGLYTLTGQASGLYAGRKLTADTAAYSLTGVDVAFRGGYNLTVDTAAYALTGQAAGLTASRRLTAATEAYSLTGNTAGFLRGNHLAADTSAYALTGNAVGLITGYAITAETGAYTFTGYAAGLEAARIFTVDTASFSLTGNTASLKVGWRMAAETAAYTLTGQAVTLEKGYFIAASLGTYTYTGQIAGFTVTRTLSAEKGTYNYTGWAAGLFVSRLLTAATESYTLTGNAATLTRQARLSAVSGAYALTGNSAVFLRAYYMAADTAIYTLTGNDARLVIFSAWWAIGSNSILEAGRMKKNVGSQVIGAQLVNASDGGAFTGAVTIYITGDGGTQNVGGVGAGACAHEGNGFHSYVPAQAETNYDHIGFTFTGTGAIPATVQLFTDFPQTGDAFAEIANLPTATENADTLLNRDMAAVSDTNDRSPLNAMRLLRNKWTSAAGTLTVKKEDDISTAWTAVLTGDASADPVVGSDPA